MKRLTTDWTDEDLIELYEERVAIRMESNGDTREQFLSDAQFEKWAQRAAYSDLRVLVGNVKVPAEVQKTVQAARR